MNRKQLLILVFSGIMVAFMLSGYLLPSRVDVVNEIIIDKAPEQIFPYIANLTYWPKWSIWSNRYDRTIEFEFPSLHQITWHSEHAGRGSMTLTRLLNEAEIHTLLQLHNENFSLPGLIRLETTDRQSTRVVWQHTIDAGNNPLRRYMMFAVTEVVKRDIDECLKGLKQFISSQPVS